MEAKIMQCRGKKGEMERLRGSGSQRKKKCGGLQEKEAEVEKWRRKRREKENQVT